MVWCRVDGGVLCSREAQALPLGLTGNYRPRTTLLCIFILGDQSISALMTCEHCCGAQKLFDEKEALKELKRYRRKGPRKTTLKLLDGLPGQDIAGMTLLDIGGGIGAIQMGLFERGLASSTDVDASRAYLKTALHEIQELGLDQKAEFIEGDFLDRYQDISGHDIVTLEKVICCYPDIEGLLNQSLAKSKLFYGIVYPRDGWLTKLIIGLANLYFRMQRNPFRSYIHPVQKVRSLIHQSGFQRMYTGTAFPWIIEWYERQQGIVD